MDETSEVQPLFTRYPLSPCLYPMYMPPLTSKVWPVM